MVHADGLLVFGIGIVEVEVVVLDILGDAIDLELWVVDTDIGIGDGHDIDLTAICLFIEQWTLAHAHTDVHLLAAHVV